MEEDVGVRKRWGEEEVRMGEEVGVGEWEKR